ncbi:MAG: carboxylating nicotinate-nucleotide diphosphorylase [Candidatus Helarchaeales archaeon]
MYLPKHVLWNRLVDCLKEDLGFGDITAIMFEEDSSCIGRVITQQAGIIAGLDEAKIIFEIVGVEVLESARDGIPVNEHQTVLIVKGDPNRMLMGERTALNFIMKMSGIATKTRQIVDVVKKISPQTRVACTRKVTPGFQYHEKRAVWLGGGDTHRFNLSDMILIKNNHIAAMGGVEQAINSVLPKKSFTKKLEVEVETLEDAIKAASMNADILMLDNFTPEGARAVIEELEKKNLRKNLLLEISGGITEENVEEYAKLKPDIISLGFLIHSAVSFQAHLTIDLECESF